MILFCVSHFVKAVRPGALPAMPNDAERLVRQPPINKLHGATNNLTRSVQRA